MRIDRIEQMHGIDSSPSGWRPGGGGEDADSEQQLRHLQQLTGDVTAR